MKNRDTEKRTISSKTKGDMIALKDWKFIHNEFDVDIKEGDDVSELGLTKELLKTLTTEGVLKGN